MVPIIGASKAEEVFEALNHIWEAGYYVNIGPHPLSPAADYWFSIERPKRKDGALQPGLRGQCEKVNLAKALREALMALRAHVDGFGGTKKPEGVS